MDFAKNIIFTSWFISTEVLAMNSTYLQRPDNVAVVAGGSVALKCIVDHPDGRDVFRWSILKNASQYPVASCNNALSASTGYELDLPSDSATCNLIILNATKEQAGQYRCYTPLEPDDTADSQVIIFDSAPQCTTQPSGLVNMSDTVLMSCSVSCYGSTETGPVMSWFNSSDLEVPSSNRGTSLSPNYVTKAAPSIPAVQSYTCVTKFTNVPPSIGSSNSATNVPSYNSTCSTPDITVHYPPYRENITIIPASSADLYLGSTVTCNASTFPPVFGYQWMNESEVIISGSSVLTLDQLGDNLTYTCAVWNALGSNMTQIVVSVILIPETTSVKPDPGSRSTISSVISDSTTKSENKPSDSDSTGVIVGAVMGVSAAILIIILIVCCCIKSCPLYNKFRPEKPGANVYNSEESFNFDDVAGHPHVEPHYVNISSNEPVNSPHYEVLNHIRNLEISPYEQLNVMSNFDHN